MLLEGAVEWLGGGHNKSLQVLDKNFLLCIELSQFTAAKSFGFVGDLGTATSKDCLALVGVNDRPLRRGPRLSSDISSHSQNPVCAFEAPKQILQRSMPDPIHPADIKPRDRQFEKEVRRERYRVSRKWETG